MAGLKLSHIYKVYDNGHKAVNDFSIDIEDKEFIVFVGPSGCGKSTTLRMIAGLEDITTGDLFIGDTLVNDMEPRDRDIAMVFQNYALYPHMTVFENMAFSLRNKHMPEAEIKERVLNAAKILDIEEYLDRKPRAMSGGQRQRVALGRAIVRNPKVFLLDEPLSNLDAKLRAQMRTEITKLHKRLATTFIYVTHDQVEAMTMGTRIVVMKLGYTQQIDTPMNLYDKPYNKFVAGFIGTPQMNFFDVTLKREGEKVRITFDNGASLLVPFKILAKAPYTYLIGEKKVTLGIRPDHVRSVPEKTGLTCKVNVVEHLGNETIVYGNINNVSVEEAENIEDSGQIILKAVGDIDFKVGDTLNLELWPEKIHFFDVESEVTIINEIPEHSRFLAKLKDDKATIFSQNVALPPALIRSLAGYDDVYFDIPPSAIKPGKDFKLKVYDVEHIGDKHLAYLIVDDRYLFALVDDKVKAGDTYSFSLDYDKISVVKDGNEIVKAVGEKDTLIGTFSKLDTRRDKQRVIDFFYEIGGIKMPAPTPNGYKLNAVDKNACYRNQYKYMFNRNAVHIVSKDSEMGIPAHVEDILDYGNVKYAVVSVGDQRISVNLNPPYIEEGAIAAIEGVGEVHYPRTLKEEEVHIGDDVKLFLHSKEIEIHSMDIDMRIC